MSEGGTLAPSGVVFDCDGLLVDTRCCWEIAYRSALADIGIALNPDRLAALSASLNGASVAGAAEQLGRAAGSPVRVEVLHEALIEAVGAEARPPMRGALELLDALDGVLPIAVASNAPLAVVDATLRGAGLRDRFSHVVSGEEVAAPKPEPAVYLEACRRLSVDPCAAIAFEDSPLGAAAARAAGMALIVVPSEPAAQFDARLRVASLDDPRILTALGLGAGEARDLRR